MALFKKKKDKAVKAEASAGTELQVDDNQAQDSSDSSDAQKSGGGKLSRIFNGGKNKSNRRLRDNERLASVVSESVPGATLSILQDNERFALPDEQGFIILGLQTQAEEFGGLSTATDKDADKGNITNLIHANDIHVVANEELLADDILGIIPDEQTMSHLTEFDIMRKARWIWMIVRIDPISGKLHVFWIPPADEDKMLKGNLFEDAEKVVNHDALMAEYVDMDLIKAMLTIDDYSVDELPDGGTYIDDAMDANQKTFLALYPEYQKVTTADYIDGLRFIFDDIEKCHDGFTASEITGVYDDQQADVEASDSADSDGPDAEDYVKKVNDTDIDAENTDTVKESSGGRHRKDGDDDDDPFADEVADEELGSEKTVVSEESAGQAVKVDRGDQTDDVDHERQDRLNDLNATVGRGVVDTAALSNEQLEVLSQSIVDKLGERERISGAQMSQDAVDAQVDQAGQPDDRVFDESDAQGVLLNKFRNDNLELVIDDTPVRTYLSFEIPQLVLPADYPHTPWLQEQLDVKVTDSNAKLAEQAKEFYSKLQKSYTTTMEKEHESIARDLATDNPRSRVADQVEALKDDERELDMRIEDDIRDGQRAVSADWDKQKADFIDSRRIQAEQEWERKFAAKRQRALDNVEDKIKADRDNTVNGGWERLHEMRRREARTLSANASQITIENLLPIRDEFVEKLNDMRSTCEQDVVEYINNHRQEDLFQAHVKSDELKHSNEIEKILKDTEARLDAMQHERDKAIEDINAARERDRASYEESIRLIKANRDSLELSHKKDKEAFENRTAEMQKLMDQADARAQAQSEDTIQALQRRLEVAEATNRDLAETMDRNPKLLVFFFIISVILVAIATAVITTIVVAA